MTPAWQMRAAIVGAAGMVGRGVPMERLWDPTVTQLLAVGRPTGKSHAKLKEHVHLHGGPASVRRYLPNVTHLGLNRAIGRGKVSDLTLPLEQVAEGCRAMSERRAIKTPLTG